ncbi:MAG: radical SAM protein [Fibrobacterota bacterium]
MRLLPLPAYVPTIRGLFRNTLARDAVYPFYASLKVTSRCHFGCPFCNMKRYRGDDLPTEDIKKIMNNLSRSPVLMTSFEGGEPLLRGDIEELLIHARRCRFYLLFTTSQGNLLEYPLQRYARYIDFLHVSIDEGHGNLELFDALPELSRLNTDVSVQTVVTRDTVDALPTKVEQCHRTNTNIVVIPAAPMEGAEQVFPDIDSFEATLRRLKAEYPGTIHTPLGYFEAYRKGKCSSASVIISPQGRLFYPCNIRETLGPNLAETDLTTWLRSNEAQQRRREMKACTINCGWYQYYSIDSYLSLPTLGEALKPALRKLTLRRKS